MRLSNKSRFVASQERCLRGDLTYPLPRRTGTGGGARSANGPVDAALGGLGISLHSTWHVCEDLRAGRLKLVLPDYRLPESAIYAVMPQRRMVLPRVKAFVDFLSQHFGDTPPWERYLTAKASKR